ncbi:MAG: tyrosine-type recombinase/integrase, partial [Sporomusa sp.]
YIEYKRTITNRICPYFEEKKIRLVDLKPHHIQSFYDYKLTEDRVKANTVLRYHANIRKALDHAVKTELIVKNPADAVSLPKKEKFVGGYYTDLELARLFKAVANTDLETPVILSAYYGFRRGEVLGLRWDGIDFADKTITVAATVTQRGEDVGRENIKVREWEAKNDTSLRTLPLVPVVEKYLLRLKQIQEDNRVLFGGEYNHQYDEYICVRKDGNLISPAYVSESFSRLLVSKGLRKIRFHDLRHSCATLLLGQGVSMKDLQCWMGHKDMATTANIYAHVEYKSKQAAAEKLQRALPKLDIGQR